ncbi:MAG TPA: NAD-glutamate dehydrogenase [Ilumatobacteraceae bacterium]|nr:NAD-glutamate dehydrogenase [Ilumatobacteraceae bacterium]HRB02399.1 NAD-glutamate dehydrogenase [Ilumatobacteraceae bacterium]
MRRRYLPAIDGASTGAVAHWLTPSSRQRRREGTAVSIQGTVGEVAADWVAATREALAAAMGEAPAAGLLDRLLPVVPAGYDELNWPSSAVVDLPIVDRLATVDDDNAVETAMLHFSEATGNEWRFRVYHAGSAVPIADLLPLLDHLGFRAIDERAFRFQLGERTVWLHDVGVQIPDDVELTAAAQAEVQRAFAAEFNNTVEVDGLNRLVLRAGLTARQVELLRAYARYLRQIGFPFSQQYIETTLVRHAGIATQLIHFFTARFTPDSADRTAEANVARTAIIEALDGVPSLDDDRTLRALLALIEATVRTNAFRAGPNAGYRDVIAFKFDTSKVPDLPLPRPLYEIWVCSPRVEGVHLRNGRIARGGIRWSDRREDFRTEVLGLVKAQIIKNAVIVPTGAKGGFVLKRPPAGPDAFRAEGVACYRQFIAGLLDLTDNIVGDEIVPPPETVRLDGDDPYLVVAADKGTASFSDIANGIAADYNFWLGDAFASGGSVGYDHKAMGITARGAWESVRRHAAVIGKDVDRDELSVVGIGDMSGDVFGNGLLRSPHVKLIAAFDHRHIFIDPSPDPAMSFAERRRLFELPRSNWSDYDVGLISAGGGVYPRTLKTIDLSPEARRRLGTDRTSMAPHELVSVILRAPVDLLWNGGIGTYVKGAGETHTDVGDRANDGLRVNGIELRCKMVGEGGNLGFTQRGRVEYALAGGLIYTDAIDNSAGVDCSDHEVNIKIALGAAVASGALTVEQRNVVLAEMTDEVGELVLDDNRAQTLALAIARRQALPMVNVHSRYLTLMESEGWLNRALEFLPTDRQIAERQAAGTGLTTPEFAVLLSYTKAANVAEMERSDLPDDSYLEPDLVRYFPQRLRREFHDQILGHRLRREIVATQVCNQLVNLSGISFDHRLSEETGLGVVEITRAWVAVRDIFGLVDLWEQVDALGGLVKLDAQLELFLELRTMSERAVMWLLRHRKAPIDIGAAVAEFQSGIAALSLGLEGQMRGRMREEAFALEAGRLAANVPEALAQRSVLWPLLHTGFDVVDLAERTKQPLHSVAGVYWEVFEQLDLGWLWDAIGKLPRSNRWQNQARSALRDDLLAALADLAEDAILAGSVADWMEASERMIARARTLFTDIRRVDTHDLTTLSVALRQLRNLALLA